MRSYSRYIFALFILFISHNVFPQVSEDESEVFSNATSLSRPVLLIFSGSDWCLPCIKFHKQILSDTSFRKFADKNLLMLKADFPQKRKLSKGLELQNEKLAERYNPNGIFPNLILLNPDNSIIGSITYTNQSPEEFTVEVKELMKKGIYFREFYAAERLMGSVFEFTLIDSSNEHGWQMIRESINEVRRIEYLISEWIDTTQVSRLNKMAGKEPMRVDGELYELIKRSIEISKITQGAFDVSFLGAGKLWKFDGSMKSLPEPDMVTKAIGNVGYEKIKLLDSCKVFLSKEGMKIGFGGIGQGYAADKVKELLLKKGIKSGLLNFTGDIVAWGKRVDGLLWKVGIGDPVDKSKIIAWLPVENAAVTTSGDYEKYAEIKGVRYSHIIDPRTGYPAKGIKSVTVVSSATELSDGLDTGVFVLGIDAGMNLIEQLPNVNCIIVDGNNKIHYSKNLKLNFSTANEHN